MASILAQSTMHSTGRIAAATQRIAATSTATSRCRPRCLRPQLFSQSRTQNYISPIRAFSSAVSTAAPPSSAPKSRDRGPASKEDTQTDFNKMDIYSTTPPPSSAIDACHSDGFVLNSGLSVLGSGVILLGGEAFRWSPWLKEGKEPGQEGGMEGKLMNTRGQVEVGTDGWGLLRLVWPKPDLLVLGTGPKIAPVSPATRKIINDLGIRLEVQDTRNAAAQFNLLATERGTQQVAAALVPIGWRDGP